MDVLQVVMCLKDGFTHAYREAIAGRALKTNRVNPQQLAHKNKKRGRTLWRECCEHGDFIHRGAITSSDTYMHPPTHTYTGRFSKDGTVRLSLLRTSTVAPLFATASGSLSPLLALRVLRIILVTFRPQLRECTSPKALRLAGTEK
jgi:hypothetical protein